MAQQYKVGGRNTHIGQEGGFNFVQYHWTKVVRWNEKEIILNSNGWKTNTTKTRINKTANQFELGFRLFQKDYSWYVEYKEKVMPYHDEMKIKR